MIETGDRRGHGWRALVLTAAVIAGVWSPGAAFAQPQRRVVAVLRPTGDDVAPTLLQRARDVLKDRLGQTGAYEVVEPPSASVASSDEPNAAEAAQQAAAVGAEVALVLRITHFGNSARLRLTAYSAATGQVAYWDSILIVGGPDDFDVAIARLVRGMQAGKPSRETSELETVTLAETRPFNRRQTSGSVGVHVLALLPFDTAGGGAAPIPGAGIYGLYDARAWMADVAFDLGGHDGRTFFDAAIGGYYPLRREAVTPYVGGVVRWAEMQLGGQGADGLAVEPTVGVLVGRASSTQLRGDLGYFFDTFGERELAASSTVEPPLHHSQGFSFTLGIGY
jgi:hypothetical protein